MAAELLSFWLNCWVLLCIAAVLAVVIVSAEMLVCCTGCCHVGRGLNLLSLLAEFAVVGLAELLFLVDFL